jgi:GNAT superfamily N-acetyltransferase
MKDTWICRDYQSGDESQILTLYKEVNAREMALSHWIWKFIQNPFGQSIMKLLFDGDKLIGFYAVIPMELRVGGGSRKAALSVNTMTHPDYQKQGIFTYLAEETYKNCQQEGISLVYGFPNKNSYNGFTHKLGWRGFGKMTVLEKQLEARTAGEIGWVGNIRRVERYDESVDILWDKIKDDYHIIVPRNEEFLNWRFTKHPGIKYEKVIFQGNNNEILGYMVLKIYHKENKLKGHIVDMLCVTEKDIVKGFLNYSYSYFTGRSIKALSCMVPEDSFYAREMIEAGFVRNEFDSHFGVRVFNREDKMTRDTENFSNWHLTMCDLDVF